MWRQEEVPAFPPEPSPTIPTRCCQHILVNKKVTRFCLPRHLWTSLYATVKEKRYKVILRNFGLFLVALRTYLMETIGISQVISHFSQAYY